MLLETRSNPKKSTKTRPQASNPPEKYVPDLVYSATRALMRARNSEEAAGILVGLVRNLGGTAVPSSANDPDAIEIDISLGLGEPVYPSAPAGSAAQWLIATYLPNAVQDAQAAFELIRRAERLASDAGIDPVSGLPDHRTLSRLVTRLEPGDAIVAVDLDWVRGIGANEGQSDQEVLRLFARDLRSATRATEFCGRSKGGEFVVLLAKPGKEGGLRLLERLKGRWTKRASARTLSFSAGIAPVDDRGWRAAFQAADSAMRRAQEAGDRWETARDDDYAAAW